MYGPPGAPGRGAAGELADCSPARRRNAFYIGNLATGAAGRISPLRPVWDSEIHPAGDHCMTVRERIRPTRPLLRPESPSLGGFYTRMRPSKGPQSPLWELNLAERRPRGGKRGPRDLEDDPFTDPLAP